MWHTLIGVFPVVFSKSGNSCKPSLHAEITRISLLMYQKMGSSAALCDCIRGLLAISQVFKSLGPSPTNIIEIIFAAIRICSFKLLLFFSSILSCFFWNMMIDRVKPLMLSTCAPKFWGAGRVWLRMLISLFIKIPTWALYDWWIEGPISSITTMITFRNRSYQHQDRSIILLKRRDWTVHVPQIKDTSYNTHCVPEWQAKSDKNGTACEHWGTVRFLDFVRSTFACQ